jgi:hypothetical protein
VLVASDSITITSGGTIDIGSHRGQTPEMGAGPATCAAGTPPNARGGGAGGSFAGIGGVGGDAWVSAVASQALPRPRSANCEVDAQPKQVKVLLATTERPASAVAPWRWSRSTGSKWQARSTQPERVDPEAGLPPVPAVVDPAV